VGVIPGPVWTGSKWHENPSPRHCGLLHFTSHIIWSIFALSLAKKLSGASMSEITSPSRQILLFSNHFADEGLAIDAAKLGLEQQGMPKLPKPG
jgi:hypothetical protein